MVLSAKEVGGINDYNYSTPNMSVLNKNLLQMNESQYNE